MSSIFLSRVATNKCDRSISRSASSKEEEAKEKSLPEAELGIICTKRYEMEVFYQYLSEVNMYSQLHMSKIEILANTCTYFTWKTESSNRTILVCSFQELQGPVECATRVVEIINRFHVTTI